MAVELREWCSLRDGNAGISTLVNLLALVLITWVGVAEACAKFDGSAAVLLGLVANFLS